MGPIFHIGYHKTGSTWLQRHLFPHGGNNFELIGERYEARSDIVAPHCLHFDAASVARKYRPAIDAALSAGRVPVFTDERFSGNPFSGGFDSREIADRIKLAFPDSRIIVVIREQAGMIYSTYDEYVCEGGICSLHDFLFPKRRLTIPLFRFEHFQYDRLISYYVELFGRRNILVLSFEQLRDAPAEFMRAIFLFAGATADSTPDPLQPENKGRGAFGLAVRRRLNPFLRRDELNGYSLFAVPHGAYYLARTLSLVGPWQLSWLDRRTKTRMMAEIVGAVRGRYAESNRRTQDLTGIDLEALGYEVPPPHRRVSEAFAAGRYG